MGALIAVRGTAIMEREDSEGQRSCLNLQYSC